MDIYFSVNFSVKWTVLLVFLFLSPVVLDLIKSLEVCLDCLPSNLRRCSTALSCLYLFRAASFRTCRDISLHLLSHHCPLVATCTSLPRCSIPLYMETDATDNVSLQFERDICSNAWREPARIKEVRKDNTDGQSMMSWKVNIHFHKAKVVTMHCFDSLLVFGLKLTPFKAAGKCRCLILSKAFDAARLFRTSSKTDFFSASSIMYCR